MTAEETALAGLALVLQGGALGWAAGIQPGPMQTYILTESTAHGWRAGVRVAFAPLFSDGPIILAILLLLQLAGQNLPDPVLAAISFLGTLVLGWLAWGLFGRWRAAAPLFDADPDAAPVRNSFRRAVLVNLTNPNPYIFWGTIGASRLNEGWQLSPLWAGGYLLAFYTIMIGTTMGFVFLGHQMRRLPPAAVRAIWLIAALIMLALAVLLLLDGLNRLGLI